MNIDDILKNPWDIFNDADEQTKQEFELSDLLVDIACKIINYRLDNNMTQKDLAKELDVTQEMVSKIEGGEYNPSVGFLFKISKKLGWKFNITFEENNTSDSKIQYNIESKGVKEPIESANKNLENLEGLAA